MGPWTGRRKTGRRGGRSRETRAPRKGRGLEPTLDIRIRQRRRSWAGAPQRSGGNPSRVKSQQAVKRACWEEGAAPGKVRRSWDEKEEGSLSGHLELRCDLDTGDLLATWGVFGVRSEVRGRAHRR